MTVEQNCTRLYIDATLAEHAREDIDATYSEDEEEKEQDNYGIFE